MSYRLDTLKRCDLMLHTATGRDGMAKKCACHGNDVRRRAHPVEKTETAE